MELQQLKTFCTIAKMQSFTQAAECLDYAQSSVSAQIRLLEEELGVKLFERMGRKVILSSSGEKLMPYAEKALKLVEEAKIVVSSGHFPKGTLTIGAPESISIYRLPEILQEYRRCWPEVELILKLGPCDEIYKWVRSGSVDIAVLMDSHMTDTDLVSETIRPEYMTLASGANHPLTFKKPINIQDMEGQQLVLIEKEACYRCLFETYLAKNEVKPSSILEIGSIEAIKKFVISGVGISFLPHMTIEKELEIGVLKDLQWYEYDFKIFTLIVYHKDKWISPAMKTFMEFTQKMLGI